MKDTCESNEIKDDDKSAGLSLNQATGPHRKPLPILDEVFQGLSCMTCINAGSRYCYLELERNRTMEHARKMEKLGLLESVTTGNGICCSPYGDSSKACDSQYITDRYGQNIKLVCSDIQDSAYTKYENSF